MFDDGFGKEEGIGLAALAALIGGGVQGARKIPVYGLETVASLLGKEGRGFLKAARELGPRDNQMWSRQLLAQNEKLAELGLSARPEIIDASSYIKDTTYRGRPAPLPSLKMLSPSTTQFDALGIPFDRGVLTDVGQIIESADPSDFTTRGKVVRKKGEKSIGASLNRLEKSLKNAKRGPDEQQLVRLLSNNIQTSLDLNDPAVAERAALNLLETMTANRSNTARVEAARARKSLGSQRKFVKAARESAVVRENVANELDKQAQVFAKEFNLEGNEAKSRFAQAFAALSPQTNLAGNWDRFKQALTMVGDTPFSDDLAVNRLDEWIRTPAGRQWFVDVNNTMLNRGASALAGGNAGATELMFEGADNLTKTGLLADILSGNIDSGIVDSAEANRILGLLPTDISQADKARNAVFSNPAVYDLATRAVNEALQSGQLGNTAWAIRPRRTGLAGQQSALQLRGLSGGGL